MNRLKAFIKRSFIGGVLVLLPMLILGFFFKWAFNLVQDLIAPLTQILLNKWGMSHFVADLLVVSIIALICFVIGTIVSTGAGRWLHSHFDRYLERLTPGYRMVRDIVMQFLGDSDSPFTKGVVAKAQIFGVDVPTAVTAIVTSEHADGSYSVFVPTGPNPTSGNIYHLRAEQVELVPGASIEACMKTIIACGSGSAELFKKV